MPAVRPATPQEAAWDQAEEAVRAQQARRNRRMLIILGSVGVGMFVFAFANVPLFSLICKKLGINWSPNAAAVATAPAGDASREVTVIFMGSVTGKLPVSFSPVQRTQKCRLGEQTLNDYHFVNLSDRKVYFRPVHTVAPLALAMDKFKLGKCFCFDDQVLQPNQSISLPVVYTIGADLDPGVKEVTLNYTLFEISEKDYKPPVAGAVHAGESPSKGTQP